MKRIKWLDYDQDLTIPKLNIYGQLQEVDFLTDDEFVDELESAWIKHYVTNSNNGIVLSNNTYKDDLYSDVVRFLHITPALEKIIKSKELLASSGGLGAAVYCSLVHKNWEIHNLATQYLAFQLPKSGSTSPDLLLIEVSVDRTMQQQIINWGIDYSEFGKINVLAWEKTKRYRSAETIQAVEHKLCSDIVTAQETIHKFSLFDLSPISFQTFETLYTNLFHILPSLRFILYEVLAEYILLYQDNPIACFYRDAKRELYNLPHKQFVFDLCPHMFSKFRMSSFFIPLRDLFDYFNSSEHFSRFQSDQLLEHLKWRIAFFIRKLVGSTFDATLCSDYHLYNYPHLFGQLIYRYDSKIKEEIEIQRAKLLLAQWKKANLLFPIFSIIPKGEIGIIPELDSLCSSYTISLAKLDSSLRYVRPMKKLPVKIKNALVNSNQRSVR